MNQSLLGQRVLFLGPRFFGYEREIVAELERRGAVVDHLNDRPFDSPLMAAITRFWPTAVMRAASRQYAERLRDLDYPNYDLVLVINGQTLTTETLLAWRERFSSARFVLYMWDSFGNRAHALANMRHFDRCLSFDREDATRYGLIFRPLFFAPGFEVSSPVEPLHDISFIGTMHSDRYAVLMAVCRALPATSQAFWYLYLQAPWVYWAYRALKSGFRSATMSEFSFLPLAKSQVQTVFSQSRAVLDIEHPLQTGLTMRTLETLGARKKLVTTNAGIRNYDFYVAENICIVDRRRPEIPADFFRTPYRDVPPDVYQRYRLAGWMDEVLGVNE